jgi:hypothetical protein
MDLPPEREQSVKPQLLYIHKTRGRQSRSIADATEQFVNATRVPVPTRAAEML